MPDTSAALQLAQALLLPAGGGRLILNEQQGVLLQPSIGLLYSLSALHQDHVTKCHLVVSKMACVGHWPNEHGVLEQHLRCRQSSLVQELQQLPLLSKCCALKGILPIIPVTALSQQFTLLLPIRQPQAAALANGNPSSTSAGVGWFLLVDGALPTACSLVEAAQEPQASFHALGALTVALQRTSTQLRVGSIPPRLLNAYLWKSS